MSGTGTVIPLKIYFPTRGFQIGVAAKSLQHLRDTLQAKMGLSNKFKLTLDDGTIVCDPEYFKLLERQTKLNVIEGSSLSKTTTNEASVDTARKRASPSAPAAANKRARLSPEGQNKTDLNTNQNNSQLLSKICISSVAGNVPMSESPKPASERPRLSTTVQQQKHLRSIPQPQVQNIPPRCTQNIRSPPAQPHQVQNTVSPLQHLHRKSAAQRPGSIIIVPPHPHIQQSIPSALVHPSLQQRPQGPHFPQQIVIPSNQPNAFPGHPHTPLSAPPIMTPPPVQWMRHGYPQSISPYGNVIHPQSQHCPPGGVLYPHQVRMPHQQVPVYQPRPPPPPPPPPQQQLTQEHIYQMQVEQKMKTTIRMTPPPNPSQLQVPLSPQPHIRPMVVAQTQPVAVIRSPVGPKPPVYQKAQPASLMPDGAHIVQQVVELMQAPEPTMIPSTPPALLKVVCSKPPTQSRHAPTSDLSNSADVSGLSSPTRVSDSESTNLQGMQVVPEDTDSEDEHALQIVVTAGESENLPPSTPLPPCALSSPQSQASSSPSRSPVVDTALNIQKPRKPTELNLQASQIDDGYCSATTSSLGSADDVKRALPFASFDEYIPFHSCYTKDKEDPQENHTIVSIVPQEKCTITNHKDDSTLSDERNQQNTATLTPSVATSEDEGNEPLIIEIPIKVIDGQIYYNHCSNVQIKEEPDVARQEIIFIDSELEDCDSDVNMFEHFISQGTPNNFRLSLDDDEISEIDTDLDISKSVESKGDDEEVVVEDHGAEVPVVTAPLDCSVTFDLDKCVADIIDVVNSKDKDMQSTNSPCNSNAETTDKVPNTASAPLNTCLGTNASTIGATCHYDGEAIVEESVLIDSSNLCEEDLLSDELIMGNEVVLSLEGSSQALDYMDSSELISNLLLHSCLPQNGRRVSLS